MKPVQVMSVPVHPVTNAMMWDQLAAMLEEPGFHSIMTPNPEMVMMANRDEALMDALLSADLVIPDGIGLIIASRLKNMGLRERVTGIDTMEKVLRLCDENNRSIFMLGGKPGRGEKALENIMRRYPGIREVAAHHGYFTKDEETEVLEIIQQQAPDVLFVCLGSPRQEVWIHRHREQLNCRLAMGTGGSVDVFAGEVKRAPVVFQKIGLEWLYRLIQEPSRFKRMTVLPVFLWQALRLKKNE
jgi:N-acetylglucosaminyldiphosphoundecaprenol N-acetyl-beta-D-mannosaminyltransferase